MFNIPIHFTIDPAFEVGPLFGRKLLNFLGIGANKDYTKLQVKNHWDDDIKITDLGLSYCKCDLNNPTVQNNASYLLNLLKIADKSNAHITTVRTLESEHMDLQAGKLAILALVCEYVIGLNKNNIWWIVQVIPRLS